MTTHPQNSNIYVEKRNNELLILAQVSMAKKPVYKRQFHTKQSQKREHGSESIAALILLSALITISLSLYLFIWV